MMWRAYVCVRVCIVINIEQRGLDSNVPGDVGLGFDLSVLETPCRDERPWLAGVQAAGRRQLRRLERDGMLFSRATEQTVTQRTCDAA